MDLDNLGPVALFIVYMAISAWSKQKKARQRNAPVDKPVFDPSQESRKPAPNMMGGILEKIKNELAELYEEPENFQPPIPAFEPELAPEMTQTTSANASRFAEGSTDDQLETPVKTKIIYLESDDAEGQSLASVLEPYSNIEQGILLHEILGKPRALQNNDDWFHKS